MHDPERLRRCPGAVDRGVIDRNRNRGGDIVGNEILQSFLARAVFPSI
jgi:hypothetical protein